MTQFTEDFERNTRGLESVNVGASAICQSCLDAYGIDPDDYGAEHAVTNIAKRDVIDRIQSDLVEMSGDSNFSWHACDGCGSTLGDNRHDAHAFDANGEVVHLDVCTDCAMYIANGELPEWDHSSESDIRAMLGAELVELIERIKLEIQPGMHAFELTDAEARDAEPSIQLTVATDDAAEHWRYQTGDNSFTGACYSEPHWSVVGVYRDSDAAELADEIAAELFERVAEAASAR